MSKYELLKWYPTLPKNWEVGMKVKKVSEPGSYYKNKYIPAAHGYNVKYINSKEVENNPEFWEVVVEKNYEILSYVYEGKIFDTKKPNNISKNAWYNKESNTWVHSTSSSVNIHSIKRLSDGEVFTVGDKIYWEWHDADVKYFTIDKLYIGNDDNLYMSTEEESIQNFNLNNNNSSFLNKLKHYKEPTFTTEDGYEVKHFNFHNMWGVALQASEGDILKKGWNKGLLDNDTPPTNRKWFWLRRNAEEYIEMNTKTYSKQDIKDAVGKVGMLGAENSPDGSSKEVILLTKERLFKQLGI